MEIVVGLVFTGKWFTGRIEILSIDKENNILRVALSKKYDTHTSNWNEDWNLAHTIVGFVIGDYFIAESK